MTDKKTPRLFMLDESLEAFIDWDSYPLSTHLDVLEDGESMTITLKRVDMSDDEYSSLPDE